MTREQYQQIGYGYLFEQSVSDQEMSDATQQYISERTTVQDGDIVDGDKLCLVSANFHGDIIIMVSREDGEFHRVNEKEAMEKGWVRKEEER